MTLKPELFLNDLKIALRSLARTKGLATTVVLTLALGIGANAAIFTLVRGVLLRPLVNRDENRLIYIRQSAPGIGVENANFSVPEIQDLKASVKTLTEFGDFSTIGFTMVGLGDPREVRAGVVGGSYFEVMGLHPVLGRLLGQMHVQRPALRLGDHRRHFVARDRPHRMDRGPDAGVLRVLERGDPPGPLRRRAVAKTPLLR